MARTASEDDVKKAHRKPARTHRPDVNPGDKTAEEKFKGLNGVDRVRALQRDNDRLRSGL